MCVKSEKLLFGFCARENVHIRGRPVMSVGQKITLQHTSFAFFTFTCKYNSLYYIVLLSYHLSTLFPSHLMHLSYLDAGFFTSC